MRYEYEVHPPGRFDKQNNGIRSMRDEGRREHTSVWALDYQGYLLLIGR